jgi:hypothetical protein
MKFVCLRYPKLEMTYKPDHKKEVDGEIIKIPREVIKFEDGYYQTEDAKQIAFIKRHVDFGNGNICVVEEDKIQSTVATPAEEKIIEKHRGRPKKVQ